MTQTSGRENTGSGRVYILALATAGWGALAFGAVYPWADWPLAGLSVVAGVAGLVVATRSDVDGTTRAFKAALFAVGAAIALQIVPLPNAIVAAISPHAAPLVSRLS